MNDINYLLSEINDSMFEGGVDADQSVTIFCSEISKSKTVMNY